MYIAHFPSAEMTDHHRYLKIIRWATARYNPSRGGRDLNTRTYQAIAVAAGWRYRSR